MRLVSPWSRCRPSAFGKSLALLVSLVAAGCSAGPKPTVGPGRTAFAGLPNLSFDFYTVTGGTVEEIRRSMNERRPRQTADGKRVDALTEWTIDWAIPAGPRGCDLAGAAVRFKARIILPRLGNPSVVPAPVLARWQAFVASLEAHEDYHARHAFTHSRDVLAAIRASNCGRAAQAAAAAVYRIAQEQRDYDRVSSHGDTEVLPFP